MFITFEGGEGSGKSTQIKKVAEWLMSQGQKVLLTREPGGSPVSEQIRKILLSAQSQDMVPECELLLYTASRVQHIKQIVKPALDRGEWVLCDRFIDSTTVYQGHARSQDFSWIETLNQHALQGVAIDLTLLFDIAPEIGLKRARDRNKILGIEGDESRFEEESLTFHKKVRAGFLDLALKFPDRIQVINADQSSDEVFIELKQPLTELLPKT